MCVYIYLFTNFLSTCGASRVAGLNQILDKQFLHAPSQIICMLYFKTPSLRLLDPQLYMLLQLGNIDQPSLFSNNPKFMTCRTFVSFIFIHVLDNKTHFPFSLPSSVFFVKEICLWGRIDPPPPPCPVVVLRSYSLTGSTCTNYNCTHDLVPWVYIERHLWA